MADTPSATDAVSRSPARDVLDPADVGAGSLAAAAAALIGPLAGAATPSPLPWADAAAARVELPAGLRHPLLLVTLLTSLATETVVVSPTTGDGAQPPVRFAPWTPAGAAVAGVVPATDADGRAGAVTVTLAAQRIVDGRAVDLVPADVPATVRVDLVEGLLGRVLAVLLAEKPRLRRAAREITAMRALAVAAGPALDRIGDDLSCPRFTDQLVWDADRGAPGAVPLTPPGTVEGDAAYRARLRVLRGVRLPSPTWVDSVLNGPDGRLADVGLTPPVTADETPNPLHLAFRLVAPGNPDARTALLSAVRAVHLIWPAGSADGDTAHAARLLPPGRRRRVDAARAVLASWQLPAGQPVAPAVADAVVVLDGRCTRLGARPWPHLLAGQSDEGGSRHELGLGARLAAPDPAALDAAATAAAGDPLLRPRPRADDPLGSWLLTAAGFRTVEALADGSVFVSTLGMGPLVVDLAAAASATDPFVATASLVSATDTAHDAPLAEVVAAVTALGPTVAADPTTLLAGIQPPTAVAGLAAALANVGLVAVADVAGFRTQLAAVSTRDFAVVDLGAAATTALLTDSAFLDRVLTTAARAGASSVVAVVTAAGTLALLFGVTGLPLAGSNLAARHTVLYRWQARTLRGGPVELAPRRGPAVQVRWRDAGLSLVSCVAQLRTGANDPYEWQPRLPPGALLTLAQYEHLMNIVELVTPAGVRADTWDLRQRHVDVDGSGTAFPLDPAAARRYRRYRRAPQRPH